MSPVSDRARIFVVHFKNFADMKKTILLCGLIAGLISSSVFIGMMILGKTDFDFENGMLIGYTLMIVAFSMIFVATHITREKYNGGTITFGKAFRIGLYITLIASTVYVATWMIDFYYFIPDFTEKYTAHLLKKMEASGAGAAEIARQKEEMASFGVMYRNPFFNALMTYSEIVPPGLILSVVSALILKRKKK